MRRRPATVPQYTNEPQSMSKPLHPTNTTPERAGGPSVPERKTSLWSLRVLPSLGLALSLGLGLSFTGPTPVSASPHQAHWHYMVGGRANAARTYCKQLHYEAIAPGPFSLELARVNGMDIARLAAEVATWARAITEVSTEEENAKIGPQIEAIENTAADLQSLAEELVGWIDVAISSHPNMPESPETADANASALRARISERTRALYHGFGRILQAHKTAEQALGIPVPDDPPPLN